MLYFHSFYLQVFPNFICGFFFDPLVGESMLFNFHDVLIFQLSSVIYF